MAPGHVQPGGHMRIGCCCWAPGPVDWYIGAVVVTGTNVDVVDATQPADVMAVDAGAMVTVGPMLPLTICAEYAMLTCGMLT